MAVEIERKFLIRDDAWRREVVSSSRIIQGYLTGDGNTVRVRLRDDDAFLTVKGRPSGLSRSEFEYPIPKADAEKMLAEMALFTAVEKIRYIVPAAGGLCWEIDEYLKENAPLFTAEIELPSEDTPVVLPEWLGREITGEKIYTNRFLSQKPYSLWDDTLL
jgi:adenylate cyclase